MSGSRPLPTTGATAESLHRRVEFLLFSAGWGANHFASMLIVYRKELGLGPAALGQLFGAYALGLVPGLILAGRWSDRWGRRLVLPAGAVAIVASALLAFGRHGFYVLLAGRLLYGLAMGCMMSPGSVWVQELSAAELGPRRATLALSAGFGLGPLASGALAEFAPAPLILPYVAHALVMALGLAAARSVPETAQLKPATGTPGEAPSAAPAFGWTELSMLAPLLPSAPWAFGLPSVSMVVLPALMRPFVARPVLYSALVTAATLFTGVLIQPFTSRLGRRADVIGLGLGALGILLGAFAVAVRAPSLVFAVALLVGAGYGIVMTTGLRYVSQRAPQQTRGTVVGLYYVLTYVGFALPFVYALAAQALGDVRTLQFTALLAFGCLALRVLLDGRAAPAPLTR